jgi:predicted nucleic acid-binding protein
VIVADASVLIALAKMRRLGLLRDVYGETFLGPVVKGEVVDQGREVGAPGVEQVEKALEAGWLRLVRLTVKEQRIMRSILRATRLDEGEAESLALAQSRNLPLVVDEKEGRGMAATLGIAHLGTAGVLLEAFLKGRLSFEELEDTVQELSRVMWLSPAVVVEILTRAREARR